MTTFPRSVPMLLFPVILLASMSARTDEIDKYITAEMKKRQIPGVALAVIKEGKVIKMKTYGLANVELGVPVTPDSVFDLASLTKQFTAAAVMLLVEDGKIGLDDNIQKYLPNLPEHWNGVTVRHLLTHSAGLKGTDLPRCGETWLLDYTTAQIFEYASKLPLDFAPGERWWYSNRGYFLLGMIIEKVSGKRYGDFLTERIFRPFGMNATTMQDGRKVIKNRAAGYYRRHGELLHSWYGIARIELSSAYGLLSTLRDLVKWDAALSGEKILKKSSLDVVWTPVKLNNGFHHNYGFGWWLDEFRGHRVTAHGGSTGTFILRLLDDKLTVIFLSNLGETPTFDPPAMARAVAGRYIPEVLPGSLREQRDPDPRQTLSMKNVLSDIANDVKDSPLLTPEFDASEVAGPWLKDLKSFTFVACEDAKASHVERFGVPVNRICYYRAADPLGTRYFLFYLTTDGKVADLLTISNTE